MTPLIPMIKEICKRFYVFEKLAVIYFVFTWVFCGIYHFKINYMLVYLCTQLFIAFSLGCFMVCIYGIFLALRHKSISWAAGQIKRSYLNVNFLIESSRMVLTLTIVLILFCNLKQLIPLVNPRLFDNTFWQMDKALHLNYSPTLLLLKIPSDSWLWPFIDKTYVTFFIKNMIVPWIFILQTKSIPLRHRFIFAACLCWIIGGLSYYLFPALGPCFVKPELFKGLNIPIAITLQNSLWSEYITFINNSLTYQAKTFYGVAAMPSLHIAIVALFYLFSLELNRVLAYLLLFYGILMFFGSVMLGWHYAIDGYVGAILAVYVYFISNYLWKVKNKSC